MLLKPEIAQLLVEQVAKEASNLLAYRQIGYLLDQNGYIGCAKWFKNASSEEQEHSDKVAQHLMDRTRGSTLGVSFYQGINTSPVLQSMPLEAFRAAYVLEIDNTIRITAIMQAAFAAGDLETFRFMEDFIEEQTLSETEITTLLSRLELVASDPVGLLLFDHELND